MTQCPFCRATYHSTHPPVSLSARQTDIYNVILESGMNGVQTNNLIASVFGENPPASAKGVIRVNIFEINRKIKEAGQRIKGRRNAGYVLTNERP